MALKVLSLETEGYRNLAPAAFLPCPGVNVIYGDNAQGKTNLLEAIWLFTGGRSFRGARDAELVGFTQEAARADLTFESGGREQTARIQVRGGRRSAALNQIAQRSAAGLVGVFCAVIFSPEHLSLVKEGPAGRRSFLDAAICQIRPAYAPLLARYQKTLAQRNALLKDIPRHRELTDTLDIWDDRLARDGERIRGTRAGYLGLLEPAAAAAYRGISGGREALSLRFAAQEEPLAEELRRARRSDIGCGHTTAGPHRDDLEILIDGLSAKSFGSQGQQRSLVLALKLGEADVLESRINESSVILLDDVMSELDAARRDYLLNHLEGRQVFLTTCEPAAGALKGGAFFEMKGGIFHVSPSGARYGD